MAKNPFTRLGRPPTMKVPKMATMPSGEKQGLGPMDKLDTAIPGKAFPRQRGFAPMAQHHDDPAYCRGGETRRR